MRKLISGGIQEKPIIQKMMEIKDDILNIAFSKRLEVDRNSIRDLLSSRIQDEKLVSVLQEAYFKAGRGTLISIGDSKGIDPYLDLKEGYFTEDLIVSQSFFKKDHRCILEGCLVAVSHLPIYNIEDITPFLQFASKHPMLIVAPFVDGKALETLIVNKEKGIIDGIAICVASEDIRNDIAAITKSTLLTRFDLKEDFNVELLGSCKEITISKNKLDLSGRLEILTHTQHEGHIEGYLEKLKIQSESTESSFMKKDILKRISKISGGICQVKIGGFTELERKGKRSEIEKALSFTNLAIKTGVIPGGNASLIFSFLELESKYKNDEIGGICLKAYLSPLSKLCRVSDHYIIDLISKHKESFEDWRGIDVSKNDLEIRHFDSSPLLCDSYGGLSYILNIATSSACELAKSALYIKGKTKR
jgi:chaperonin GroEL